MSRSLEIFKSSPKKVSKLAAAIEKSTILSDEIHRLNRVLIGQGLVKLVTQADLASLIAAEI
jgi:hypothetical protein